MENELDWRFVLAMIGMKPAETLPDFHRDLERLMTDRDFIYCAPSMLNSATVDEADPFSSASVKLEVLTCADMTNVEFVTLELNGRHRNNMELAFCCIGNGGKRHFVAESDFVRCFGGKITDSLDALTLGDILWRASCRLMRGWQATGEPNFGVPPYLRKHLSLATGPRRLTQLGAKEIAVPLLEYIGVPYMDGGRIITPSLAKDDDSLAIPELESDRRQKELEDGRALNPSFGALAF